MSNEFLVQKGFLDEFSVFKGDGHAPDTLPSDPGRDVTDSAGIDSAAVDKTGANIKPGENKPGGPGTTMADDLSEVAGEAKKDIEATYVSDSQNLGGEKNEIEKGWESYNHMVEKGFVVDQNSFSRYDIDGSFDTIEKSVHNQLAIGEPDSKWMVAKELDDSLVVEKGFVVQPAVGAILGRAGAKGKDKDKATLHGAGIGLATGLGSEIAKVPVVLPSVLRGRLSPAAIAGAAGIGALGTGLAGTLAYRHGKKLSERAKEAKEFSGEIVEKVVTPGPGKVYESWGGKLAEEARRRKMGAKTQEAASRVGDVVEAGAGKAKEGYAALKRLPKWAKIAAGAAGAAGLGYGGYRALQEEKGASEDELVFKCSSTIRVPKGKVRK